MIKTCLLTIGLALALGSNWAADTQEETRRLVSMCLSRMSSHEVGCSKQRDFLVRVVDGESGAPVPEADICITRNEGFLRLGELKNQSAEDLIERIGLQFRADKSGELRIEKPKEPLRIFAFKAGVSGEGYYHLGSSEIRVPVAPCPSVSVQVKDQYGKAVAGARVELKRLQKGCTRYAFHNERTTGAQGEALFRIHDLWAEQEDLSFALIGIFLQSIRKDCGSFDTKAQSLTLTAPPHGSLLIQVVPEAGCILPRDGLRVLAYPRRTNDDSGFVKSVMHLPHAEVDANLSQAQFNLVGLNQEIWVRWGSNIPGSFRSEPIQVTGPKQAGEEVIIRLKLSASILQSLMQPLE